MTLAQLAITVALLGALGLAASRVGLSAIPAYLLAGLLLGPNEPKALSLIRPSEVTDFVAEIGLVFLLFFLGLEFTLGRLVRSRRHALVGGAIDLLVNAGLGLAVGVIAFGLSFGALVLAAAIYVSSSAITVKGLIDFRRLADEETDLVLAGLVASGCWMGRRAGFAAGGGYVAGVVGGLTRRQSFNAGVALVAHGEFTIILAQIATRNPQISSQTEETLAAFAGLYVLITATIGVALMKESKLIGRVLFPVSRLAEGA